MPERPLVREKKLNDLGAAAFKGLRALGSGDPIEVCLKW